MVKVERFSFSTPPKLMKQFDDSLRALGYKGRSKALQIAMRNFITEYAWKSERGKIGAGAILLTYEHHMHSIQEELTSIQHRYRDVIGSTTHIHLDESRCLEMISFRGKLERIRLMAENLMKTRGVSQFKISIISL